MKQDKNRAANRYCLPAVYPGLLFFCVFLMAGLVEAGDAAGNETSIFRLNNPQILAVVDESSSTSGSMSVSFTGTGGSTVVSTQWAVISNGPFKVSFSSTSQENPEFSKNDASDPDSMVYLETRFGVVISDTGISTEKNNWWGGSDENAATTAPVATGENLIKAYSAETPPPGSPDAAIGSIMPGDNTGSALVTLYARCFFTEETPPGNYNLSITLRAWPHTAN